MIMETTGERSYQPGFGQFFHLVLGWKSMARGRESPLDPLQAGLGKSHLCHSNPDRAAEQANQNLFRDERSQQFGVSRPAKAFDQSDPTMTVFAP